MLSCWGFASLNPSHPLPKVGFETASSHKIIYSRAIILFFIILWSTGAAEELNHTHRVLGLFQADREDDLGQVINKVPDVDLVTVEYKTGEAVFRYDAEKLAQNLDQIVRRESRSTFEILPPSSVDRSKLRRVEIDVVGLDCKGCSYAAYLAVYKIEGVENATASFKEGKVVAWIDDKRVNRAMLIEALKKKRVKIKEQVEQ